MDSLIDTLSNVVDVIGRFGICLFDLSKVFSGVIDYVVDVASSVKDIINNFM